MGLLIRQGGFYTTIQDKGRYRYQQYGMPVSGAMDQYSLALGNLLVGNPAGMETLEATVVPPVIVFEQDNVFAVTGAECRVFLNRVPLQMNKAYIGRQGDLLECSAAESGCRIYLCFHGGFDVPVVMGSKSTYGKGKIGGLEGRALKAGDRLCFADPAAELPNLDYREIPVSYLLKNGGKQEIRVVMDELSGHFSAGGYRTFLGEEYRVTQESDRMGYRLEGSVIEHNQGQDGNIISDAIAFGAIQVAGHGQPIIMMSDRQTTGGYTKIGTVISADLPKVAQAKAGDVFCFQKVPVQQAQYLLREREKALRELDRLLNHTRIVGRTEWNLSVDGKQYQVQVHELNG